jgi:hypothetical protein
MKGFCVGIMFFFIIAIGAALYAEEPVKTSGWYYCPYCSRYLGPQTGYGMGKGMSGGQGIMDSVGYGMVPGMSGGNYNYQRVQRNIKQSEACKRFLDETADLRKELHDKRFAYFEAIRDPKTDPEDIKKLERKLQELQGEISLKRPIECIL